MVGVRIPNASFTVHRPPNHQVRMEDEDSPREFEPSRSLSPRRDTRLQPTKTVCSAS